MATDYGTDIACDGSDLDPMFPLVTGRRVLTNALARRFATPRGALFYDPSYGLDLREYVNEALAPADVADLQRDIEAQALADERVASCAVALAFNAAARTLAVTLALVDAEGPFRLVLAVDAVTVAVLATA